jgi:NDP-sugar pyrophosphorylase family protein
MNPGCLILAGGQASRMLPLTLETPKSLLPVAGKPFILHQLDWLYEHGIFDVVVGIGHLGDQVRTLLHDEVRYSDDGPTPLGTGGAVKKAAPMFDGPFLVVYGDSYLSVDPVVVYRAWRRTALEAMLTLWKGVDYGLLVLTHEAVERIPDGPSDLNDLFHELQRIRECATFEVTDRFHEIGSPEGLRALEEHLG